MRRVLISLVSLLSMFLLACEEPETKAPTAADSNPNLESSGVMGNTLGSVDFTSTCDAEVQSDVVRAVTLLHHMMYQAARAEFANIHKADPECAIAYWGEAMTYIHPLWPDRSSPEVIATGRDLAAKAEAAEHQDGREAAYARTVAAYFGAPNGATEEERLIAFEAAWRVAADANPDDREANAFHGLSELATVAKTDKSYVVQRDVAKRMAALMAEMPDHPAGHHYLIHAFDTPELAPDAVEVARNYGRIAPDVPHALHMPTHIFTRLGLWDEQIAFNERSATAAERLSETTGEISLHYLHAQDYLAYARLQIADDEGAEKVLADLNALTAPYQNLNLPAGAYPHAAVPARIAVETQDWERAAELIPGRPEDFPWARVPETYVGISYFARALGRARSGRTEDARADVAELARIRDVVAETDAYWSNQVEIERLAALGWIEWAEGDRDAALASAKAAAEAERATFLHGITPGEVVPAGELYADMLMLAEDYATALVEYRAALARSPRRFSSLYGVGRAAELLGDAETARAYYAALVEQCVEAGDSRERLVHARAFLAQGA